METPVRLEIFADRSDQNRSEFVKILSYLAEAGTLVFDEQLEPLNVSLPGDVLSKIKRFSQRNPDFFTCLETFEESDQSVKAIFIAGWDAEECISSLKDILSSLELKYRID